MNLYLKSFFYFFIFSSCILYELGAPVAYLSVSVLVFIVVILFSKPSLNLNVNLVFAIFSATLCVPLFLTLVTGLPLVFVASGVRANLNNNVFVLKALYFVLLQVFIFLYYSKCYSSVSIFDVINNNVKPKSFLYCKNFFLIGVVIISSYLSNRTGTIFDSNYGSEEFYSGSSSFGGGPIIFCFALASLVVMNNISKKLCFFIVLVILYWLFHGNRSEILTLAVLPFINMLYNSSGSLSKMKVIKFSFVFVIIIGLFQFIGLYREVSSINEVASNSRNLSDTRSLSISTVGPSAYTIVSTIGLVETNKLQYQNFDLYLSLLSKSIPSALNPIESTPDFSEYLIANADAIGGSNNIAEAYASFGSFGVVFFSLFLSLIFRRLSLTSGINFSGRIFILAIFIYMPRIVLYGNIYLLKFVTFFFAIYVIRFLILKGRSL